MAGQSEGWSLEDLPDELLLKILLCDAVRVQDLARVASTSSRFKRIVETQNLWRIKLKLHWPKVWEELPAITTITDWQEEVQQAVCFSREVLEMVQGLSARLHHHAHLTTTVYNEIDALACSTPNALLYIMSTLRNIIEDGPEHPRPVELRPPNPRHPNPPRPDDPLINNYNDPNPPPPANPPNPSNPPSPPNPSDNGAAGNATNSASAAPKKSAPKPPPQPKPVQPRPNWERVMKPLSSKHTKRFQNLTEKHYAWKVEIHVHKCLCQREWSEFLALPPSEQSLELGAMLVARWFQPHAALTVKKMSSRLDILAESCRSKLSTQHPDHPALTTTLLPPSTTLRESKWSVDRCRQIFKCVNHVLYTQFKMSGNCDDYYNLKNSLLNEVLASRRGIPITLSIVYRAICHRLGVLVQPVNYPSHFILGWKLTGSDEYEYIDAFNKGRRLSEKELIIEIPLNQSLDRNSFLTPCTPPQVFQRMIRNIMNVAQMQDHMSDHLELFCPATELMSLLTPEDRNVLELLLRIYYTLEIHHDRIVAGCESLLQESPSTILEEMLHDSREILERQQARGSDPVPRITPKAPRVSQIKFATGLVMRHRRYHYTCVIYGWDKECTMPGDWVRRMGVQNLKHKTSQPFYNVLVTDGSNRYAAQENLEVSLEPTPVGHSDIGKYFHEFNGTHYLPNDELSQQYPDDHHVRCGLLQERGLL